MTQIELVQSAPETHSTQTPVPSQSLPPPRTHGVPVAAGGFEGTPLEQRSAVHSLPSSGTSASSAESTSAPLPSQTRTWQSPGVCDASGVPAATSSAEQVPASQV